MMNTRKAITLAMARRTVPGLAYIATTRSKALVPIFLAIFLMALLVSTAIAQSTLPPIPTSPPHYGVHDDPIGESWTTYVQNNHVPKPKKNRMPDSCEAVTGISWDCRQSEGSYADKTWRSTSYHFDQLILQSILRLFDTAQYALTKDAIINKYGQPGNTTEHPYTNGYGATFTGEIVTWKQSGTTINLFELSGTPGTSMFIIDDDAYSAAHTSAAQAAANKRF
jgi:hypothetical protein